MIAGVYNVSRRKKNDKWFSWRDWFKPKETVATFKPKSLDEQRQAFFDMRRYRKGK